MEAVPMVVCFELLICQDWKSGALFSREGSDFPPSFSAPATVKSPHIRTLCFSIEMEWVIWQTWLPLNVVLSLQAKVFSLDFINPFHQPSSFGEVFGKFPMRSHVNYTQESFLSGLFTIKAWSVECLPRDDYPSGQFLHFSPHRTPRAPSQWP